MRRATLDADRHCGVKDNTNIKIAKFGQINNVAVMKA